LILAIDPGSQKCGVAVVGEQGEVIYKATVATLELLPAVTEQVRRHTITVIVLGNRTGSKAIEAALLPLAFPIKFVEEDQSSLEGRYRYLRENTTGLARLLPIGLRVPKQPFDEYVAVILAERYLKLKKNT
jgi:RNase H-fold protein (predicted Holliday junction resolvase)